MSKSAKGTFKNPGVQVKSKLGLNRSILDQGLRELNRQLAYKLKWRDGELITVNPKNTSQKCASYRHVDSL